MLDFLLAIPPALLPFQGLPPEELPFERLGRVLLHASEGAEHQGERHDRLSERLEPLFETLDLGALEVWLPRSVISHEGELELARRPREWKQVVDGVLALEGRWAQQFEVLRDGDVEVLGQAVTSLRVAVREFSKHGPLSFDELESDAAQALRIALLGTDSQENVPMLIVAPTRAHYVAVIGVAGILQPKTQPRLWTAHARSSLRQPLNPSVLLLALTLGPSTSDSPWFVNEGVQGDDVLQYTLHSCSHMLSTRLVPAAPFWFCEGLAIRDTVSIAGADETLCTGYKGPGPSPFPLQSFMSLILSYTERSPYRGRASGHLFLKELHDASVEGGFEIVDLERSKTALVATGPFLGQDALPPREVADGPPGLQEGFAEFYRAYVTAFVDWLGREPALNDRPLLPQVLSRLHASGYRSGVSMTLEQVLSELSGRTLGLGKDPERDLEAAFALWIRSR